MTEFRFLIIHNDFVDSPILHFLGTLPTLKCLVLEGIEDWKFAPLSFGSSANPFSHLLELALLGGGDGPSKLLEYVTSTTLESLHFSWLWGPLENHGELIASMAWLTRRPLSRLRRLSFTFPPVCPTISVAVKLFGNASRFFEPLLKLSSLRVFRADLDILFVVDNAFLHSLAVALPMLEVFSIIPQSNRGAERYISYGADSPATLDGLLPLAERCPNLVEIGLAVAPRFSPGFDVLLAKDGRSTHYAKSVTTLDLWVGPMGMLDMWDPSPSTVSAFLASTFPGLDSFRFGLYNISFTRAHSDLMDLKWIGIAA